MCWLLNPEGKHTGNKGPLSLTNAKVTFKRFIFLSSKLAQLFHFVGNTLKTASLVCLNGRLPKLSLNFVSRLVLVFQWLLSLFCTT